MCVCGEFSLFENLKFKVAEVVSRVRFAAHLFMYSFAIYGCCWFLALFFLAMFLMSNKYKAENIVSNKVQGELSGDC